MFKTNYTLLLASRGRPVCTNSGAHPGRAPGGGGRRLPRERQRPPPRRGSRARLRGPRRRPIPARRAPRGGQPAPREGAGRETAFPQREKLGRPLSGGARRCGGFCVPPVPAGSGAGAARPPGALRRCQKAAEPGGWRPAPSAPAGPRGWAAEGGPAAGDPRRELAACLPGR